MSSNIVAKVWRITIYWFFGLLHLQSLTQTLQHKPQTTHPMILMLHFLVPFVLLPVFIKLYLVHASSICPFHLTVMVRCPQTSGHIVYITLNIHHITQIHYIHYILTTNYWSNNYDFALNLFYYVCCGRKRKAHVNGKTLNPQHFSMTPSFLLKSPP